MHWILLGKKLRQSEQSNSRNPVIYPAFVTNTTILTNTEKSKGGMENKRETAILVSALVLLL